MMRITAQLAALAALCTVATGVRAAEGDPAKGENVVTKCKICHQVGEGAKNQVGPQLNGIVGRKAGSAEGFNYSPAMRGAGEKGLVWDDAALQQYTENPKEFVP